MKQVLCAILVLCSIPAITFAEDPPTTQKSVEVADYKALKEALPEKLFSLERKEISGQKVKQGDLVMSTAEAQYGKDEGEAPKTISVSVIDYAGMSAMAEGLAVWEKIDMAQESDEGFTKMESINGRKVMLTYQNKDKNGSIQMLINKRLIVNIQVNNVTAEELRAVAADFNTDRLSAAAPEAK
jgi:hypothetical protein